MLSTTITQTIKLFDDAYRNENVEVKFNFSNESYRKSASEQLVRRNNAKNFLYMVNDFRNIVSNAVPIEIHSDRIKNGALKSTRVFVSAFWNGETVVPVEITIKEYKQPNTDPKLYMAITINKEGDTVTTGSPSQGPPIIAPPSTINLSDLVKGVNSNNKDFLKYFPDSVLSSEQIEYKKTALENERIKYEGKNAASVLPTAVQSGTSTITTNDNSNVLPTATDTNSNNNFGIVNQDAQQLFEDLQNTKTDIRSKARRAYQSTISGWAPFERMTKADTRRGGRNITGLVNKLSQKGGVFDSIKERGLFDINANKVSNQTLDNVVKQVPTNQLNDFNTYWHELHNIDRLAQNKPVTEHTADESRQIVAQAMLID